MQTNTENFEYEDFHNSAIETVNYFFEGFPTYFVTRDSFTESELNHVIDIVASVYMTQYGYRIGGGFVQSVLDNNLSQAFSRADSTVLKGMRMIVYAKDYGVVKKFKPHFETI
jgi:hypothetical protein